MERKLAFGLVAAVFLLLVGAVQPLHTLGVRAEFDNYHGMTGDLLAGRVPDDPFHGLLVPMLAAPIAALGGDVFAATKLVSILSATLLVWATVALASTLGGPRRGLAAGALVAVNGWFVTFAVLTAADMTSAALVTLSLAILARYPRDQRRGMAFGAGLAAGLATAARFSAMPLALVVLATVALSARRRGLHALVALAGFLVGYAPQGAASVIAHGHPFHNHGWHNMPIKVLHSWDTFDYVPADHPSLTAFLWEHGTAVVGAGLADCGEVVTGTWGQLLSGRDPGPLLGVALTLLVLGAGWWSSARQRPFAPVAAFALLHTIIVCFTFRPEPRVLLPILPLGITALVGLPWERLGRRLPVIIWSVAMVIASSAVPGRLSAMLDEEPHEEVALARELPRRLGRSPVLASSYMLMRQHVRYVCWHVPPLAAGDNSGDSNWERLRAFGGRWANDTFLIGRRSAPHQFAALAASPVPGDFAELERTPQLLLLRWQRPESTVILEAAVDPEVYRGGELRLSMALSPAVESASIGLLGFLVRGADGGQFTVELRDRVDGRWQATLTPGLPPGDYELVPFVVLRSGTVERGAPVMLQVR